MRGARDQVMPRKVKMDSSIKPNTKRLLQVDMHLYVKSRTLTVKPQDAVVPSSLGGGIAKEKAEESPSSQPRTPPKAQGEGRS